jgi:serine/threonine protein kinase
MRSLKMLGRGGMGAVYMGDRNLSGPACGHQDPLQRLEEADPSFAERFKNEASAMAKLSHPGIVGRV